MSNPSLPNNEEKQLKSEIEKFTQEMTRLRRINRNWDAGLTITTITLTLAITILASLNQVNEQNKNTLTSILGAVIVAIQSIGNAFPVKQKAGSYRLLQVQASNLLIDIGQLENAEEFKAIESQFYQLRNESAKIEVQ